MKFERDYFIHYYDCDTKKKTLITSLMRYLEDIATLQSEHRGVGLDYYETTKRAWVIYKWDIKINKYPLFMDTIKVITEPTGFVRFYAYRKYEMRSSSDELLVTGNSLWFFVDTVAKRPTKITEDMHKGYNFVPGTLIELPIEDSALPEKIDYEKEFFVRQADIDTNNHVNNIKYVEWAMEAIPLELQNEYSLTRLKVTYKKETHYGSKIKSVVDICKEDRSMICKHKIIDGEEDICFLETGWVKEL